MKEIAVYSQSQWRQFSKNKSKKLRIGCKRVTALSEATKVGWYFVYIWCYKLLFSSFIFSFLLRVLRLCQVLVDFKIFNRCLWSCFLLFYWRPTWDFFHRFLLQFDFFFFFLVLIIILFEDCHRFFQYTRHALVWGLLRFITNSYFTFEPCEAISNFRALLFDWLGWFLYSIFPQRNIFWHGLQVIRCNSLL